MEVRTVVSISRAHCNHILHRYSLMNASGHGSLGNKASASTESFLKVNKKKGKEKKKKRRKQASTV